MQEGMQEWLLSDLQQVLSFTGEQEREKREKKKISCLLTHGNFVVITSLMN